MPASYHSSRITLHLGNTLVLRIELTFERQKQISEQVEADLQTQRIQQRTVKKQLEDDKRLFYLI